MEMIINNSFCSLSNVPPAINDVVTRVLTYQNDIEGEKGQLFNKMRMLKQYGPKQKVGESESQRAARGRSTMGLYQKQLKELEAKEWVCWYQNGAFPTGHLKIVQAALARLQCQYSSIDNRIVPSNDLILNWSNKPFDPRYYQKNMIELGIKEGRGVFESAVGTGKSLIMAYLVKELSVNTLIVVPSRGLSDQLYNDFVAWFGNQKVQIVDTKAVRSGKRLKPIRIVTIQSLASLQKSGELRNLIGDVKALHVDEIHHAGAASYTNLLSEMNHIYYRFGYTGTFLRNDAKILDMWGFLSTVLYKYPAHQAIAEGFLTPLVVKRYTLTGKRSQRYQKEYDNNYCGGHELMQSVYNICTSVESDKQILILVNRKDKSGKLIHEMLNQLGISNSYVSGDNKKEEITQMIVDFNEKKIRILIGSSVVGEGIDVRSTDHLIMAQGGKSEIVIVQATGRVIRLFDGKATAYVHDFNFTGTRFMGKHYSQRMEIYARNFGCEFLDVN